MKIVLHGKLEGREIRAACEMPGIIPFEVTSIELYGCNPMANNRTFIPLNRFADLVVKVMEVGSQVEVEFQRYLNMEE